MPRQGVKEHLHLFLEKERREEKETTTGEHNAIGAAVPQTDANIPLFAALRSLHFTGYPKLRSISWTPQAQASGEGEPGDLLPR